MQGCNIVLAAMPKSGSTFVSRKLRELIGYPLVMRRADVEIQQLDPVKFEETKTDGLIDHIHLFCTHQTVATLNSSNARIIILWRNLLDVVVSHRDFNLSEEMANALRQRHVFTSPGLVFEFEHFRNLTTHRQYSLLIDTFVPWCINFYASWKMRAHLLNIEPAWIDYDTFFADPVTHMDKLLRHCGFQLGRTHIKKTLDSAGTNTRLNKGVSGRGLHQLSEEHIRRVEAILDNYPPQYVEELRPRATRNLETPVCT